MVFILLMSEENSGSKSSSYLDSMPVIQDLNGNAGMLYNPPYHVSYDVVASVNSLQHHSRARTAYAPDEVTILNISTRGIPWV